MTPKEFYVKMEKLEKKKQKFTEKHNAEYQALVAKCPHDWIYEPDPSGNNDSGYCCSRCHHWSKRIPE